MITSLLLMLASFSEPILVNAGSASTPSGQMVASNDASRQFNYDAVDETKRRKAVPIDSRDADRMLDPSRRAKLTSYSRDSVRNITTVAWACRRHLDYVTTLTFHGRVKKDKGFSRELASWMANYSRAYNCDVGERHDLQKMLRLAEAHAIIEGDNGLMKLANGAMQGISGARVRNRNGVPISDEWRHGIQVGPGGYARNYALHKRVDGGRFEFERMVPARNMMWHGYYDEWEQTRGVSPIVPALNLFRDVYENFNFALTKAKVSQLFAIAFFRKAALDAPGVISTDQTEEEIVDGPKYDIDFGRGPLSLDLDDGDEFKIIESNTPSSQLQDFTRLVSMVALKSLDIPYCVYDEGYTNFYGQRAAWTQYDIACDDKRDKVITLANKITAWRLAMAIVNGELILPRTLSFEDIAWEWVPAGIAWWDPSKEINAGVQAVSAAFDTPQNIVKKTSGRDVFDNIDEIAEVMEYARKKEVPLSYVPLAPTIDVVPAEQAAESNA